MSSSARQVEVCSDRRLKCGVTRAQLDKSCAATQTKITTSLTVKTEPKVRRVQKRSLGISLDIDACKGQNIKVPCMTPTPPCSLERENSATSVSGCSSAGTYQTVCTAMTTPVTGLIQFIDQVFMTDTNRRPSSSSSASSCSSESSSRSSSRSSSPEPQRICEEIVLPCQVTTEESATRLRLKVRYPNDNRAWNAVRLRNNFPILLSGGSASNFIAWKLQQNYYVFAFEDASKTYYITAPSASGLLKLSTAGVSPLQIGNVMSDPRVFQLYRSPRTGKWHLRPASNSKLFVGFNGANILTVERVLERNAKPWRVAQ